MASPATSQAKSPAASPVKCQRALIAKVPPIRLTLRDRVKYYIPLEEMDPTECCSSPFCKPCVESKQSTSTPSAKKMKYDVSPEKENSYWSVLPFPPEINFNILNSASLSTAKHRLSNGWDLIHHALQPCSVCGKLLAIRVDDTGEIITSGKLFFCFSTLVRNH